MSIASVQSILADVPVVVVNNNIVQPNLSLGPVQPGNPDWRNINTISQWCSDITSGLRRAKTQAYLSVRHGDYASAASVLVNGLQKASNSIQGAIPLTATAIERGLVLNQVFSNSSAGASNALRSQVYFLDRYYQFIFDVSNRLDIPYYIPYQYGRARHGLDMLEFERRYIEYARAEVQVIIDSFVQVVRDGRGSVAVPIGPTGSFLAILSQSLHFAAHDLSQSIFANSFACAIDGLKDLAQTLDGGAFYYAPDLVNYAYQETQNLLNEMKPRMSCGDDWSWKRKRNNDPVYPEEKPYYPYEGDGYLK
jgi:hypothetical protein